MKRYCLFVAVTIICTSFSLKSQKLEHTSPNFKLTKPSGQPMATLVNINNISMWVRADGRSGRNPISGKAGTIFPRGTTNVIFQDGIIWGGLVKDGQPPTLRVGGQRYNVGTVPGRITSRGVAELPTEPDVRIWRIRPDWRTADLTRDAAEHNNIPVADVTKEHIREVRQQYANDWFQWPWQKGAPFYDDNGNGIMDAGEEPGLAGADQVVWFVANDLDSAVVSDYFGSPPIGLEMQVTLWAYKQPDVLQNTVFKRYRLIYKGTAKTPDTARIDSMYIAQWSDPDLGTYSDDFVGCDSLLSLGYVYNGRLADPQFDKFNLLPPAFGYDFVQGPIVPGNAGDRAIFDFRKMTHFKNLPMTSFAFFAAGSAIAPFYCGHGSYECTVEHWNVLRGFTPQSDPRNPERFWTVDGEPTRFPLAGDPLSGQGDIDGIILPPGDRRMFLSSGPFNMALGDTQEVVIALIGATGADHLLSVADLKQASDHIQSIYNSLFTSTVPNVTVAPEYFEDETRFTIQAQAPDAREVLAQFSASSGKLAKTLPLFDDGAHHDSLANDGIWGNQWTTEIQHQGLSLGLVTINTDSLNWPRLVQQIPTFGPVETLKLRVSSDNINSDGQINPGENVHLSALVGNGSKRLLGSLKLRLETEDPWVTVQNPSQEMPALNTRDTTAVVYDLDNPESYFALQFDPATPPSHVVDVDITHYDTNFNLWRNKLTLTVEPFPAEPETQSVQHLQGPATGTFGLYVVQPSALTGHTYRITIEHSIFTDRFKNTHRIPLFNLIDRT
ncbi:hypothetical protein GWO43_04255, partial [candidate division KSB1 bacterium]|nr:hypothetical protein [candidate division KSB1 bacterium]NIR70518.1 hypothetical protein [candidate division KSB1 bacterium]NIS24517.1 hypothetical protein [candidate division KSB1 bacterium]NIT70112.1 hypothetical protein [candidate division KSB1 bacterium]NIU23767.1 hypothetical protein [candidate division KSB1 bacterium]